KDNEGKIAGLVGINRDITLSKQAEEKKSLLQDIVAKINTTLNFEESLESIVKGAVELVSVRTAGVIHLFDIDRQNIAKSYAFPESFVHAPRFPEKTALTWQILETGELIEIPDISESNRVSETMRQSDVKSIIGVPLKLSGKVIGVLYLKTFEKHKLTRDEKTVLTMLCEHASIVIEKARRYEHLDLLREVSGKISATLDLDKIMSLILKGAIRLTGAAFGDVHLIDQKSISISHSFEYPDDFKHPAPRLSEKKGLTWTIMEPGNPVIIPDITEDSRVNKVLLERGVRSLIG
ncbi:MAG: GAF domain-containing protein, partial [Desulfobacteraceae bacterium]|nr:GAF domain-containing protein [Desulfobacteraceae bacterium]